MEQLPSNLPPGSTEKAMRWLPLIAGGIALFWFWGTVSSFVLRTLEDTMLSLFYGGILLAVGLFVWSNPSFLWMSYKTICRKITSYFIKMDPLSYMDRYADLLTEKLNNLNKSKVKLSGQKVKLERQIQDLTTKRDDNLKLGVAAVKVQGKDSPQASLAGLKAKGAQGSIDLYQPTLERMTRSLTFMDALSENWDTSIAAMRDQIALKREEYETLKANAAALSQADEFLKGDTEESRIYKESVQALEANVSQKIAYIEDFEKRAKPIMEGAAIEKTMNQDEGNDMISDYMNNTKLFLPTDFSKIEAIPYQDVPAEDKFHLQTKQS